MWYFGENLSYPLSNHWLHIDVETGMYQNSCCWLICFCLILQCIRCSYLSSASGTVLMMAHKAGLILLLIISMNVHQFLSQCTTFHWCWLRNTRGTSVNSSSIPRHSMSTNCPRMCSLDSQCIATSYDSASDNCELHEAGKEGTRCISLKADEGSSFWMMKTPGRSCPKVIWVCVCMCACVCLCVCEGGLLLHSQIGNG